MSQISVNNMTFGYEGAAYNIFEDVSFSIDTSWKLGFIGRNGKGKTTFLNLLMGRYDYSGSITAGAVFDYFPYQITREQSAKSAIEFVDDLKPGLEIWRVYVELDKLGADADIMCRQFDTLSFGERTKILLAVLFSGGNDLLLIDEPTNHLDAASREIVKAYLADKKGFILVSHDRELLDACIDHVLVLNRNTIEVQTGNFSSWWENKEKKDAFALAENEKHLKEIDKLNKAAGRVRQWSDKNERTKIGFDPVKEHDRCLDTRAFIGAKTKKMQSRVKSMENRIQTEIEEKEGLLKDLEKEIDLRLTPLYHHKKTLITAYEYGLRYNDAPNPLFEAMSFEIKSGERVFLNGGNGCGKSSIIKTIIGDKSNLVLSGELTMASGLKISYINQDTSHLKGTLHDYCEAQAIDETLMYNVLTQLDVGRAQFKMRMEDFSEGQKKKVLIAASLVTPAHLYIWDEPLNYIDVFSRIQIEKLILKYQPTMLIVEHDKSFRSRIATKIVEL